MGRPVRRVVTGHDATGKAIVLMDGPSPTWNRNAASDTESGLVWVTDGAPADVSVTSDQSARKIGIPPPANGSICRVVEFGPTTKEMEALPATHFSASMGADHVGKGRPPRHPFMHRTKSIDYAIVLEGEIDMLLDDSEVHLNAGDVLVQQATNHAWVNRSGKPCRICFVLIDAKEL
jgi:mannose-6-phosphate isomerase-like protein (cupin superfamily)